MVVYIVFWSLVHVYKPLSSYNMTKLTFSSYTLNIYISRILTFQENISRKTFTKNIVVLSSTSCFDRQYRKQNCASNHFMGFEWNYITHSDHDISSFCNSSKNCQSKSMEKMSVNSSLFCFLRAPGKHRGSENKNVWAKALLWPSPSASEQNTRKSSGGDDSWFRGGKGVLCWFSESTFTTVCFTMHISRT